jgi:hypothetical protein
MKNKTKRIVKKRENGFRRVQIDCSEPKITDQSDAKAADINNIMKTYQKTGIFPEVNDRIGQYIDNTDMPSLEEMHDQAVKAKSLFMELPSALRKLMDNDPTKMAEFISDPSNIEICKKYGILKINKVASEQDVPSSPPAAAPAEQKPAQDKPAKTE